MTVNGKLRMMMLIPTILKKHDCKCILRYINTKVIENAAFIASEIANARKSSIESAKLSTSIERPSSSSEDSSAAMF